MLLRHRSGLTFVSALVSALVITTAQPAAAASPPRLDTVAVSATAVQAPGSVVLSYTATEQDAVVTQALAGYTDEGGRAYSVALSSGTSGSGTLKLPEGVRNGLWTLQYVYLASSAGNTYVCRTGRANTGCTEFRDLSAYNVTLSGSTWDAVAPLVTEVHANEVPVRPGEDLIVGFAAAETHQMASLAFLFKNTAPEARGDQISVSSTVPSTLGAGQLTIPVKSGAYEGQYVLQHISARDSLGNTAYYLPDGSVVLGGGALSPTSHGLDFAAISFTVTGSTQDVAPPALQSIATSATTTTAGLGVSLAYSATDAHTPLNAVRLHYRAPDGGEWYVGPSAPAAAAGTVPLSVLAAGDYQLVKVVLEDTARNLIEYRRDGTTYNPLTKATGTHTFDLARGDVRATPSAVQAWARSRPRSVLLSWSTPVEEATSLTGYRIVVNPGGRVITVASSPTGQNSTTITGLTNAVKYSFTVTAQSAVGPGPSRTVTATPLLSNNVWGGGDVNGDRRNDLFAHLPTDGKVRLYRGSNAPGFGGGTTVAEAGDVRTFPGGRMDGYASYLVVDGAGHLDANVVGRTGVMKYGMELGPGWGGMRLLDASADFSGDGVADIVGVTAGGSAYLYRGYGGNQYAKGTRLATGWSTLQTVFASGDVTGDRRPDLLVVDAKGSLWIHPGNGAGGFSTRRLVSSGWGGLGALFSARDVTGDGRVDLGAVTMDGALRVYRGRGNGTFTGATVVSTGWGAYL